MLRSNGLVSSGIVAANQAIGNKDNEKIDPVLEDYNLIFDLTNGIDSDDYDYDNLPLYSNEFTREPQNKISETNTEISTANKDCV